MCMIYLSQILYIFWIEICFIVHSNKGLRFLAWLIYSLKLKITVRKIPYTNNHRKHLRISITLCFAGSESEDSCLSPNSTASGSGASPLRLPTRPNYTQDGYAYTPYSHETYMMAPKSRISPYTRTLDYPSYHHARMKEFYQGTNSCGYNF